MGPRTQVVQTRTWHVGRELEPSMRFRHLRNFILDSASYSKSLLRLRSWYARSGHVGAQTLPLHLSSIT